MSESGSESDFDTALWAAFRASATPKKASAASGTDETNLFDSEVEDAVQEALPQEAVQEALPQEAAEPQPSTPPSYRQREKARRRMLSKSRNADDYAAMQEEVDEQHAEQGFVLEDEVESGQVQLSKKKCKFGVNC